MNKISSSIPSDKCVRMRVHRTADEKARSASTSVDGGMVSRLIVRGRLLEVLSTQSSTFKQRHFLSYYRQLNVTVMWCMCGLYILVWIRTSILRWPTAAACRTSCSDIDFFKCLCQQYRFKSNLDAILTVALVLEADVDAHNRPLNPPIINAY
jgi:hypothetical protein